MIELAARNYAQSEGIDTIIASIPLTDDELASATLDVPRRSVAGVIARRPVRRTRPRELTSEQEHQASDPDAATFGKLAYSAAGHCELPCIEGWT
jgi:hypothetical protein